MYEIIIIDCSHRICRFNYTLIVDTMNTSFWMIIMSGYNERTKVSEMPPLEDIDDNDLIHVVHAGRNYHTRFKEFAKGIVEKVGGFIDLRGIKLLDYKGLQGTTSFGVRVEEQIGALFNGGYLRPTGRPVSVPYNVMTQFGLFDASVETMYFPLAEVYNNSSSFKLPLLGIHTLSYDLPHISSDFKMNGTYDRAFNSFKLNRDKPAFAVLSGTLDVLVRIPSSDVESAPYAKLSIRHSPKVNYELTETNGLALSAVHEDAEIIYLNPHSLKNKLVDIPFPTLPQLVEKYGKSDLIPLAFEQGLFTVGSKEEILVSDSTFKYYTTGWFDVGSERILLFRTSNTLSEVRVQYKDKFGEIFYDTVNSSTLDSSDGVFYFPPGAVWARMCSKIKGTLINQISVRYIPTEVNPYAGSWARYKFNVCKDVTFVPNAEHWFDLTVVTKGESVKVSSDGLIILGGGLTALINVKDNVQRLFENMELRDGDDS